MTRGFSNGKDQPPSDRFDRWDAAVRKFAREDIAGRGGTSYSARASRFPPAIPAPRPGRAVALLDRWSRIGAPTFEGDDDKTQYAGVVNMVLLGVAAFVAMNGVATIFVYVQKLHALALLLALLIVLLVSRRLMHLGRVYLASAVVVSGLWLVFTVRDVLSGGTFGLGIVLSYTLVCVIASLLLGPRSALTALIASAAVLVGLAASLALGLQPPRVFLDRPTSLAVAYTFLFLLFVGIRAFQSVRQVMAEGRAREHGFGQVIEQAVDGMVIIDQSGQTLLANAALCDMLGYTEAEIHDLRVVDTLLRAEEPAGVDRFAPLRAGERLQFQRTVSKKNGRTVTVEVTASRLKDGRLQGVVRDISERARADLALRESEERFRRLSAASFEGICVSDNGRIVDGNAQIARMLGYEVGELLGMPVIDLVAPEHHDLVTRHIREGSVERYEHLALRKDRKRIPVEVQGRSIPFGGRMLRVTAVRDLTPRKGAEEAQHAIYRIAEAANSLAELPELLLRVHEIVAQLLPAHNLYIALYDEITALLSFPYWVDEHDPEPPPPRTLGRGLTEYILRTGESLLVSPDMHRQLEERGEVELLGAPSLDWIGVPLRLQDRTIGVLVVQTYSEGIRYGEREKDILQFVSTQIAMAIERKRAEAQLRESEHRYRLLFELNPEAMWVYDTTTLGVLAVNDAALRRYGYSRSEFLAMTIKDLRPPSEVPQLEEILTHDSTSPRVYADLHHRRKDGSVLNVEVLSDAIAFGGRSSRLVLARDVTERKELESQFRQAQKMEAVGQLAGGVAHDFNNLLTAITGYSELLLLDFATGDPRRQDVDEIRGAARRAAALTQQLLAFSRKQVLKPQVLDLNSVVTNAEKLLLRLIGENISLKTALDPYLGAVRADPAQLEQVIMNLAVNARDAMPLGGRLLIETANADLDATETAEHSVVNPGSYVHVTISDTGMGMDDATKLHAFEPFFTTKGLGKGTGLGLSTVYGIVKQSGGFIRVRSQLGKGTAFDIYLPRVDAPAEAVPATTSSTSIPTGTETILLVEDEPALRAVARRALQGQGYTILEAGDGEAAIALATTHRGRVHLVVTDVVMPGLSGPALAAQLINTQPTARVLYMSGYTDDLIVQHGVLQPGVAFLQKPFSPETLSKKVREVLDAPTLGDPLT
jgi:two-component system, cell cycle sensor histidine kinase and response regulator CckA